MPQLGESVAEGTIGEWLKKPGDHVAKYEPLLEVITDKVNAEVPSPFEGTLTQILVEEGATVPNNAEIAVIEEAGAAAAATVAAPAASAKAEAASAPESPAKVEAAPRRAEAAPANATEPCPALAPGDSAVAHGPAATDGRAAHELPGNADARMTPAVRRLLREHELSAAMIVGTGGGGRITREDVSDYIESQRTGKPVGKQDAAGGAAAPAPAATPAAPSAPAQAPAAPATAPVAGAPMAAAPRQMPAATVGPGITFPEGADEVLVPMTQMRKGIAAQMTRA